MWLFSSLRTMDQLGRTTALMRLGCVLMIAAAGLRAVYAALFEAEFFANTPFLWTQWTVAYAAFVVAYAAASWVRTPKRTQVALLVVQSAAALFMIWLYPNFIVTALLVVVAWQIAWVTTLRQAVMSCVLLSLLLTLMKCVDQNSSMSLLVLITTSGFELFAVSAAHLARSEAMARESLAKVNAELRATQALLTEGARMAERLRISRDLHDILGHNLTSLTIRLDVANRLAHGESAEHLQLARGIAAKLLDEVRAVVREVRVQPVDLRATLHSLTEGLVGLRVHLIIPEALAPLDPPRADAVLRCVQELITNTLRHAQAHELTIELQQSADGSLAISAHDDGHGGEIVEGQGLAGMRERFELLGGTLSFASAPGAGFTMRGRIPVGAMP
jgi:signal transduction histidine kinase